MQPEDFLLSIKDDIEYARDTASGEIDKRHSVSGGKPTTDVQKLVTIQKTLDGLIQRLETYHKSQEMAPYCGLYLFDGGRQYGFTFEQLKDQLEAYNDPKSALYRQDWGFTSLLQWLYEVGHTSIGDLHGDLPKHVVVTYHRPSDFSEEEMDAKDKEYNAFWEKVKKLFKPGA